MFENHYFTEPCSQLLNTGGERCAQVKAQQQMEESQDALRTGDNEEFSCAKKRGCPRNAASILFEPLSLYRGSSFIDEERRGQC